MDSVTTDSYPDKLSQVDYQRFSIDVRTRNVTAEATINNQIIF